ENFPEAREKWQTAFRYILVDEYQDTNHAQYRFLQLMAAHHKNLFAVRAPAESEAASPGTRVIPLEQNYRSTNTILRGANAVIANNRERKPKELWSELGEGEPVHVIEVEDAHAEARMRAPRDRAPRRGGLQRRRGRGLLPDERTVARARGRARAPGDPVPGDRRPAVLRARGGSGRGCVSPGDSK